MESIVAYQWDLWSAQLVFIVTLGKPDREPRKWRWKRSRFFSPKVEFSLWRVKVLTFVHFGGWEFSLQWVRVFTVACESCHCSVGAKPKGFSNMNCQAITQQPKSIFWNENGTTSRDRTAKLLYYNLHVSYLIVVHTISSLNCCFSGTSLGVNNWFTNDVVNCWRILAWAKRISKKAPRSKTVN